MFKIRFLSMLALLCLTVSGARAQTETLLTTILSTDDPSFKSGSKTFDNKATVTFSDKVLNGGEILGWYSRAERTLTVTAAEGYTITRVKFYTFFNSAFDEQAPFEAILVRDGVNITKVNGTSIGTVGVTKIEVYGYATPTYKVSLKGGTEDATSWQGKAGTGEYQALPLTGLDVGTAVSVKYSGGKLVKSVKATKKVKPAAEATAEDKGKLIGADGNIYDTKDEAEDASTTAVAKIIYIGPTGHATYNHGLALALTDEGEMAWGAAMTACNNKNTSTPVTGATWLLASNDQWNSMIDGAGSWWALRDGFSSVGGSNLKSRNYWYWLSSERNADVAWCYTFDSGTFSYSSKGSAFCVRACLAFGAQETVTLNHSANNTWAQETVTLNHSANNTWAIAATPAGGVELEVEYFNITVPTANTDIYIGTTTPLINAGSTTEDGATMKYLVTATNEQPTSTDGFSADVPTAQAITCPGTYYVWYYLDLASGDDSDISALAVEVTVSFHVTMKEGTEDATSWQGKAGTGEYQALPLKGVAAGTAVSVKYNGTKLVKSVKAMNHSANNTWTLASMPEYDVELEVEYFNITVPTANTADIYAGTTTPLINAGSTTEDGATIKYLVTATNEQPTSTDGFSAHVPTALPLTGPGTYYVWYYLDFFGSGDNSDISALAVEVTVKAYAITMKEGTLDATNWQGKAGTGEYQALPLEGVAAGTAVSVKYNGTKLVKSVKAMNHSANNTWTLASMPEYDVELEVEYFNITVPTANTADIYASTTPLINAGSTTEDGATMKYLVTATNEQPTSTDGFSAAVPTAKGRTAGTYYVWYYLDFASGDDSDISALAVEVTVKATPTYKVTMKGGTEDATSWQGKAGTGEYQALPLKRVAAGTAVSVKYNGTKLVKSVKGTKKVKPAAEATAEDKGKLIGRDGRIYDTKDDAEDAGTTAVAMIIYIGPTGHATYTHGLALALTDEPFIWHAMTWQHAIDACSAKNTSTPVTGATWLLASVDQWEYMMGTNGAGSYTALRDGFSSVGGSNLLWGVSDYYWSSTENGSGLAWRYDFGHGNWLDEDKGNYYIRVRACLAFGAQETVTLNHSANNAWAQEETLLTTILSTGDNASFKSGSKTFDNKATVTFSGTVYNNDDEWGWYSQEERTLTVTAAENYTITRVKFYTDEGSGFDEEAPFEAILVNDGGIITKVNGTKIGIGGVTKIEVYGYADIVNHCANNTWAIAEMPDSGVELEVEYFNITVPTANTADIYIGTTTPLINAGSTTEDGATMKYLVTATNEQPTSTDGFSTDVPTALPLTGPGTYYVWYYLDFATGAHSDISALAVEVTVSFHVTMKEGTLDADNWQGKAGEGEYQALPLTGLEAGTAVSVKYSGTKKVKSVKAVKAAPALNLTSPAVGQVIGKDGKNYDYASLPGGVTAVAKICYVSGSNGLALALTDEGEMNWESAVTTAAAHTPVFSNATWKLATKDEWNNMITAAGGYEALRDGFRGITGARNMRSTTYRSSTESGSDNAWSYFFGPGVWIDGSKDYAGFSVRACLAFGAQGSDPIDLTPSADGTVWTLAATPAFDVELEVEYYDEVTLAIGTLHTRTGEVSFDSEAWYTPDGKRLNAKPNTKGIYVNNGKKVVIK